MWFLDREKSKVFLPLPMRSQLSLGGFKGLQQVVFLNVWVLTIAYNIERANDFAAFVVQGHNSL